MAQQLFVHIGTHKTGTTSIQAILYRFGSKLRRAGTTVPKTGCPNIRLAGHHNIGWLLRGDPRANPKWGSLQDLAAELRTIRTPRAVISSEDLEYLAGHPDQLRAFEAAIRGAGWEPTYILFLREPGSYAISLYHELLKSGLATSFEAFVEELLRDSRFQMLGDWTYYLDYGAFLRQWRSVATGGMVIRSYDRAKAGAGVIETFLECIGVPPDLAGLHDGAVRAGPFERLLQRLGWRRRYVEGPNPAQLNISGAELTPQMRALAAPISEKYGPIHEQIVAEPVIAAA